jgi:hypothetical protein
VSDETEQQRPRAAPAASLLSAALAWHEAGCSVVPPAQDGSKRPVGGWKRYQAERPDLGQLVAWYAQGEQAGVGLVCGAVSGGLEMLELEGRAVAAGLLDAARQLAADSGLGEVWAKAFGGYMEATPSGGLHVLYRLADIAVPGNLKLARRPTLDNPTRPEVLAETRGEGGYVVVAPTGGTVHATGRAWVTTVGNPASIPTLTGEEREALHDVFRALDEMPVPAPPAAPTPAHHQPLEGTPPGEAWAARVDWADILIPHGWTHVATRGDTRHWRRPGKQVGISATTGYGSSDLLYVFSTSTEFESERSYTKFGALAVLQHGGDYAAAARALRAAGYGTRLPTSGEQQNAALTDMIPRTSPGAPTLTVVDGTAVRALPAADSAVAPSWQPVDLGPILDGTYSQPEPTLMRRTDGAALLYPGLVHSLHGESESGKSLIIQAEAARLLAAGERVLYLDYESDAPSIVGRLLAMGAPAAAIRANLRYVRPEVAPWQLAEETAAWEALLAQPAALAVIDGVTDALGTTGATSKDADEVSQWHRRVPRTLAVRTGAAVVLIDHVSKDADSRGRFAVGSQAKLAALDGAAYVVETAEPLGRGLRGVVVLRVAKDRPGAVRPQSGTYRKSDRTQEAARIVVDSTDGDSIRVSVEPPDTTPAAERGTSAGFGAGAGFRPTALMEQVSMLLAGEGPLSLNKLRQGVKARSMYIDQAAERLAEEGFVERSRGVRGAMVYTSVKPYQQAADIQSDRYKPDILDGLIPSTSSHLVPTPLTSANGSGNGSVSGWTDEVVSGQSDMEHEQPSELTSSHLVPPRPDLVPDEVTTSSRRPRPVPRTPKGDGDEGRGRGGGSDEVRPRPEAEGHPE